MADTTVVPHFGPPTRLLDALGRRVVPGPCRAERRRPEVRQRSFPAEPAWAPLAAPLFRSLWIARFAMCAVAAALATEPADSG